jgi:hypothetical protein
MLSLLITYMTILHNLTYGCPLTNLANWNVNNHLISLLYNYNSVSVRPTTVPHFNWRGGIGPDSRIPRSGIGPDNRIPKTGTGPDWERAARQGRAGGRVGQGAGVRAGSGRGFEKTGFGRTGGQTGQGRAGPGRAGQGGRGQGRAPTGDFTVAFGHRHPLVSLKTAWEPSVIKCHTGNFQLKIQVHFQCSVSPEEQGVPEESGLLARGGVGRVLTSGTPPLWGC